ncbi:MAG: cupin domain-containing protein [Acidobacteria bacterium]|nr:cupin domain-containing protein [Acidobacteriota bacterium]
MGTLNGKRRFVSPEDITARRIPGDHGGKGTIEFRRLLSRSEFATSIDFVDFTIVPPGCVIGLHEHSGNEEIYFVVSGSPLITVDDEQRRLQCGSIAVVRSGQKHGLHNDTERNVEIFVIQVREEPTNAFADVVDLVKS